MTSSLILPGVIAALTELSDRETQDRLWVHGGPEGMSSFTEAICRVFDDAGVTRAIDAGRLKEPLLGLFHELDALIDKIPENVPPEEIIEHPAMPDVRRVSLQLLKALG